MLSEVNNDIKTTWDTSHIFVSYEEMYKHIDLLEEAHSKFCDLYAGNDDYLLTPQSLRVAIEEYSLLIALDDKAPSFYLNRIIDVSSTDEKAQKEYAKIQIRMQEIHNSRIFFTNSIKKIPLADQQRFLDDVELQTYKVYLEQLFRQGAYTLSDEVEKVLNLTSSITYDRWVDGFQKIENSQTIEWQNDTIPLSAGNKILGTLSSSEERSDLWNRMVNKFIELAPFCEHEINAIFTSKQIDERLRNFNNPLSQPLLYNQNSEEELNALQEAVVDSYDLSREFYNLHAKISNISHPTYVDRFASVHNTSERFTFDRTYNLLLEQYRDLGTWYETNFKKIVYEGRVDVFPKKGKTGGAYCAGSISKPTYILLNHVDNLDSYMTFAHEMGHAFHGMYTRNQPPLLQGFTISTAEVASTFFENIAFNHIFDQLSDKDKLIALESRIGDAFQTVHRQIAFHNFELELNKLIRTEGFVEHSQIASMLSAHMNAYLGYDVSTRDGYQFVDWSHLRYDFYTYTYAYGFLVSSALYRNVIQDPSYMKQVEEFMKAGSSLQPVDIFKSIGVDTSDASFWKAGIDHIRTDVERLKKLVSIHE